MRFPLFLAALLALVSACADAQPPRPLVVLVHGRGHLEDDTAALRVEWKRNVDSALSRAGSPPLRPGDVALAWYADVMDPAREVSCARPEVLDHDSLGVEAFARGVVGALAAAVPTAESRGARVLLGDVLYALDPERRCAAADRLRGVLAQAQRQRRPVVVVAYSLGSLVSYGALSGTDPGGPRAALVTLGSPLGDGDLRALLGASSDSLRIPPGVARWENVYDPGDPFAAPLSESVRGVNDVQLSTRGADAVEAHHVNRYLGDAATGAALTRALCAAGAAQYCR